MWSKRTSMEGYLVEYVAGRGVARLKDDDEHHVADVAGVRV